MESYHFIVRNICRVLKTRGHAETRGNRVDAIHERKTLLMFYSMVDWAVRRVVRPP